MFLRAAALLSVLATALANPSGVYTGSKTVLGETINAQISVTSESLLDLQISGVIDLACTDEAYTMGATEITLDHIDEAGDCAHDALEQNNVKLEKTVYDESADTLTVSVKYSVLSIDLVLSKASAFDAPVIKVALPASLSTTPSGAYSGSKSVLGETINALVSVNSDTSMDLTISGVIELSCADEAYHLDGSDVVVDNIDQDGDCAHDALAENGVTLKSVSYDDANDEITVSVKYSVLSIDLVLSKNGEYRTVITLADAPHGSYTGSKTVLGQKIETHIKVNSETSMDLAISGVISLSCTDESYHLDGSEVVVDNLDVDGDCAHDALDENGVTFKSATYDESKDEVTVTVKYSVMTIDMVLTQDGQAEIVKVSKSLRGSAKALA